MDEDLESTQTAEQLARHIRKDGPVTVAQFMDIATEAYYAKGTAFGKDGDFITAPEISQVFGELVGLWAVTAWQALGQPRSFHLVECGPGRGTLMSDVLRTVSDIEPRFGHSASVHLVERSQKLRERQAQMLADYHPEWHADLSTIPDGPLIILANEFLDALPIEQFVKTQSGWCQRLITYGTDGFSFAVAPLVTTPLTDVFDDAPAGSILERSRAIEQVVHDLGTLCMTRPGIALLIDYGHTTTSVGETLQAVKGHKFHPVLEQPGDADLTAHVDFAAVEQAARISGARVHGPIAQGLWLQRLGIGVRQAQLSEGKTPHEVSSIQTSIQRLIAPEHMGTLFKAMALGPKDIPALAGFEANADVC